MIFKSDKWKQLKKQLLKYDGDIQKRELYSCIELSIIHNGIKYIIICKFNDHIREYDITTWAKSNGDNKYIHLKQFLPAKKIFNYMNRLCEKRKAQTYKKQCENALFGK